MLRKKNHVVRKKNHVVRKLFYVASPFTYRQPRRAGRRGKKRPRRGRKFPRRGRFLPRHLFLVRGGCNFLENKDGLPTCLGGALGMYWAGSRSPLMAAGYLACASCQPPQCADTHAPPVHLNARPLQRRSLFYLPLQHLFHPSLSFSKPHAPRLRCPALVRPAHSHSLPAP